MDKRGVSIANHWVVLLLLLLAAPSFYAQKTIVSGKVIDAETKEALPFVNVVFQDSKVGTSTDIDGNYRIETYYPTDSLQASFLGYNSLAKSVKKDVEQKVNFALSPGGVDIEEVVIEYEGNPAHDILRRIWRNREANNREKYDYYHYEVYNKVEFDLNNVTEDFKKKKIFKNFQFIFDYVDSTSEEKQFLPMFMTESLSDYYYRRSPKSEKEYIKASQVSGTSNESITQFLGDMYQKVNVYENTIDVFGKSFVSPISTTGLLYYRYYLKDSVYIDNRYCYEIDFVPRMKHEPVFSGTMWVNDTTYAIKRIEAGINENANINFINGFEVKQEYKKVDNQYWMLSKDELVVDFQVGEKIMGLYGRKHTSYKDFVINKPLEDKYYEGIDNVTVLKDANNKEQSFWQTARHDTLSKNQQGIYEMVDSVKNVPAFRTFIDVVQLIFTGYKEVGWFEIGPYFKAYSYNPVEGHRFRLGGRTSNNFSTRVMLNGYLAYGLTDQRFKYNGGVLYKLSDNPRQRVEFQYKRDVEQLGQSRNAFAEDNILSSFLRRNPNDKLTDVESFEFSYEREWITGFSNKLFLTKRLMRPLGSLEYRRFNADPEIGVVEDEMINTSEVSLYTRFAYKEKFVEGEFERLSLGSEYPILEFQLTMGLKDFLDGDYDYQKLELAISDNINTGVLGYSKVRFTAGKYFGTLPYPLLEIHNGNETYFYDQQAFNLMNFFEFISDEYATIMYTHHFDGFFLNKIPLLRKLKWREVVAARAVAGNLSNRHRSEFILPNNIFELNEPYTEIAMGIENIFKVIRIDAMWRLNYLDHPNIAKFGIRGAFEFSF
ncbi:MAG: hypothetical protein CMC96_07230 [Flavobacteriales bacterium]|nr:hypothetical protein [Flavobacteriales bacterium]|tara:strand:+ start:115975 stop:118455 length:2481 start_codon:yes stop_codon:yes gene_type:complete